MKYQIDGIIFDLGSTLIEYENIPWEVLNLKCLESGYSFLMENIGKPSDFEGFRNNYIAIRNDFRTYAVSTLREWTITDAIYQLLLLSGLEDGYKLTGEFFHAYYQPVAEQLTIFNDTISVLEALKSSGKKIGLLSNTIFPEKYHQDELERFGIKEYFDFTIFSSSFGYRKPHPLIYDRAVSLMKLDKESLLFIGDRYIEDFWGPRQFGLKAILKYREGRDYPKSVNQGIPIIKNLSEIFGYIES
jgi:putative hydrolase of the HAD superfamily